MTLTMRTFGVILVLILVASMGTFAAQFDFDGEYNVGFITAPDNTFRFGNITTNLNLLKLNLGIEEPGQWSIQFKELVTSNSSGQVTLGTPEFRAQLNTDIVDFDVWGNHYDAAENVLADPAYLLVLGTRGPLAHLGQDPAYSGAQPKLRATFKALSAYNAVVQVHRVSTGTNGRTHLELYGDYDIQNINIGSIVRYVINNNNAIDNETKLVVFGTTELNEYRLGASIGNRFGGSVGGDAFAFGLTASTDYSEALNFQGNFVQRGANFFGVETGEDRAYQRARFRNASSTLSQGEGKGSIIELIATYRGEGDRNASVPNYVNEDLFEDRSINNFINPIEAAKYPSLSAQGILRIQSDESAHAEQHIIVRAGMPLIDKLWGAAELGIRRDQDGAGAVAGVASDSMVSNLVASLLYELNANWDAQLVLGLETAHASGNNGSLLGAIASVSYEVGAATTTFGLSHEKASNQSANRQLFGQFEIKF